MHPSVMIPKEDLKPVATLMKPLLVGMLFIEDRRQSPRQHDYHKRHIDTDRESEDTPAARRAPPYGTTGPPPQEYDADDSPQPATYR